MASDVADLPMASARDDPSDHFLSAFCPQCGHAVDAVCPKCLHAVEPTGAECRADNRLSHGQLEVIRVIIQYCLSHPKARRTMACLDIALGFAGAEGRTMADYARRFRVGRATISKQCRQICSDLGIPPSNYMRDDKTRAQFRLTNRRPLKL